MKLVNVSNEGADGMEHDEAVKMVNFSRTKKPAKCDLDTFPRESLVTGWWSPGVGRVSVTVTFSAIGSINTTFETTGLSL